MDEERGIQKAAEPGATKAAPPTLQSLSEPSLASCVNDLFTQPHGRAHSWAQFMALDSAEQVGGPAQVSGVASGHQQPPPRGTASCLQSQDRAVTLAAQTKHGHGLSGV